MIVRHCTNMVSVIVSFPGPMFIFPCVSVVYHAILLGPGDNMVIFKSHLGYRLNCCSVHRKT